MTALRITSPAALAVSLADAQIALRMESDDPRLAQVVPAIRALTQEVEHATRRAFVTQGWRITLDAFPAEICAPAAPLVSVQSIQYLDANGVLQTLPPTEYEVDVDAVPGQIIPAYGKAWPLTAARSNAVRVTCTLGYSADDSAVPDCAKQYILARLCEQFDPSNQAPSPHLERLLDPIRVYA